MEKGIRENNGIYSRTGTKVLSILLKQRSVSQLQGYCGSSPTICIGYQIGTNRHPFSFPLALIVDPGLEVSLDDTDPRFDGPLQPQKTAGYSVFQGHSESWDGSVQINHHSTDRFVIGRRIYTIRIVPSFIDKISGTLATFTTRSQWFNAKFSKTIFHRNFLIKMCLKPGSLGKD